MYKNQGDGTGGFGESASSHSCRVCGRVFSTMSALNSHMIDEEPPRRHPCNICNEVFSSGQALGGHKRCHQQAQPSLSTLDLDNSVPPHPPPPPSSTYSSGQYQCDICNRVFPTGQALGGHRVYCKRSYQVAHIQENSQPPPPSSFVDLSAQHKCDFCNKVFSMPQALGSHRAPCERRHLLTQQSVIKPASSALPLSSSANSSVQGQDTGDSQTQVDPNKIPPSRDDEDDASSYIAKHLV